MINSTTYIYTIHIIHLFSSFSTEYNIKYVPLDNIRQAYQKLYKQAYKQNK